MLGTVLLILLILLLIGALPAWSYASWGYGPSGGVFILLVILLILMITGRM